MRVLLIEDELKIASFIKRGLQEQSYQVDTAHDGVTGLRAAYDNAYDVLIVDISLPKLNGLDVIRRLQAEGNTMPILVLTSQGTTDDIVTGFDAGADDYLVKPFAFRELLVRLRTLNRRNNPAGDTAAVLQLADLELHIDRKVAKRAGTTISLTHREFRLLEYLMKHHGRVVSKLDIAEHVLDLNKSDNNTVEMSITALRKKIDKPFGSVLVHTVFGLGYVLRA